MTRPISQSHPLHRLFRGLTESTFMDELGIGDPGLVGYVADLLARFVPSQALGKVRDASGRSVTQVFAMIAEAESSADAERRRECHRHVGDYTLFWTGVYPEALGQAPGARPRPTPSSTSRPRGNGPTTWPARSPRPRPRSSAASAPSSSCAPSGSPGSAASGSGTTPSRPGGRP